MKSKKETKRKADTGLIVGIIAIVINIITVTVYMYQASIMQRQQHASAWPYLEWLPTFNEIDGFKIELSNNGTGPALIKSVTIKVNGQKVENMDSLCVKLIGTDYFPHLIGTVQNRVLPPGRTIKSITVENPEWAGKLFLALQNNIFEYEICYESIYGDQWICKGTTVVEGTCEQVLRTK